MARLQPGDHAPDFSAIDIHGNTIRFAALRGQKVMLNFYRFATCPFCTVRFVRMTQEAERYAAMGVKTIAIFESSGDYVRQYLNRRELPFPVIADPDGVLYRAYGVEKSVRGLMFGMFRIPTLLKALFDPEFRMGRPDASVTRIPADLLIGPDLQVVDAYYGSDIGDHIPFSRIDDFAQADAGERLFDTAGG